MNGSRWIWRPGVALAAMLLAGGVLTAQQGDPERRVGGDTFGGFTRPSLEVAVGSRVAGLVAEVLVEEGQAVRKGEVLLRLDDSAEKIEVELSRLVAESDKNVEAMKLIARQREADLERTKLLLDKGSVTGVEYEQAQLQVKVAQLNVQIAETKQQAAHLQYQRDLMRLAERQIRSPADGVVTRLHKDPGESVERLEKVAEVVQLDPLEIVLNVPVATRGRYAADRPARVCLVGEETWHEATVKMVDPVVDFASSTYRVKVRLPNPGGRMQAGLGVTVDLRP